MSDLARVIRRVAQTDGDHSTVIPALTLHRRSAPSEPLHCIYNLGLGVVAQGGKQVLLGGDAIDYGPARRSSAASTAACLAIRRSAISNAFGSSERRRKVAVLFFNFAAFDIEAAVL
jgi:hypothetical protein